VGLKRHQTKFNFGFAVLISLMAIEFCCSTKYYQLLFFNLKSAEIVISLESFLALIAAVSHAFGRGLSG